MRTFSNTYIKNMWNKIISNSFVLIDKYREFLRTIQFLWFTKLILSLVSISAGYFFVFSLFIKLFYLPKLAGFFSIIILAALEAVNFYLPMKYFKFMLNPLEELEKHSYFSVKKVKRFLLISSIFGFGLSFYLSAQGAKYFLNHSADQTKEISAWYKSAKAEIDTRYDKLGSNLQTEKTNIQSNPTVYKAGGHQPTMLSTEQLKRISDINEQLIDLDKKHSQEYADLKAEYKEKLKGNKKDISKEGWKYFLFAGLLIIVLNIVNYFIVYFSKVIKLAQDESTEFKKMRQWKEEVKKQAIIMAENDIQRSLANFQSVSAHKNERSPNIPHTPQDIPHISPQSVQSTDNEYDLNTEIQKEDEPVLDDLTFEGILKQYEKNVYATSLLNKYPKASKMLIEREQARRDGTPQITIEEIKTLSGAGKTTLYKILSVLNFK